MVKRELTPDELSILCYIQDIYGDQNTSEDVFITKGDEAVIFVKDVYCKKGLSVVLTNVAEFAKLENLSREQLFKKYLLP